jgi:anti-anti-sigma regulatory factor
VSVTHLLTLSGRLNELELELLELAVQTIVASGGRDVVVDLSMAELPDRALVHALGRARALMIAAGGALSVANRDVVRKAYTIERLGPPQLASLGYLNEVLEADPQRGSRG